MSTTPWEPKNLFSFKKNLYWILTCAEITLASSISVLLTPTVVIDTSMGRSSWVVHHWNSKIWFVFPKTEFSTWIHNHSIRSQHISMLTTCTFMFRQVCTTEPSFLRTTSGMYRRQFEGRHLVVECEEASRLGDKYRALSRRGWKAPQGENIGLEQFRDHFEIITIDRYQEPPEEIARAADVGRMNKRVRNHLG